MRGLSITQTLLTFLQQHSASLYRIAFSGGLDSHVLLHACAALQTQYPHLIFCAIHVDHGLQADSTHWATHCQQVCQQYAISCEVERLQLTVPAGASLEAVAREARYAAFTRYLQAGEILLTAHHQDDQAETLLLNLMRGSSPYGLAAMPALRPLGAGQLGRPLLHCSRAELAAYAEHHRLPFIHDPSNQDPRFARNFLRHQVIPLLQQRWQSVQKTLARAAQLQAESRQLLTDFLRQTLPEVQGSQPNTLSVQSLLAQDSVMQKALIREWLAGQGLPLPEEQQVLRVLTEVLRAAPDATPCMRWQGCEVRRYRDDLYAMPPLSAHDPRQVLAWDIAAPLRIASTQQTLQPELLGVWRDYAQQHQLNVQVRFRQGGEKVYLPQRGGHHDLKKLLQEAGIPPWQRDRLPLIYVGQELVMVWGVCTRPSPRTRA